MVVVITRFSMPLKCIKGWNWENIWLIYCTWGATLFPLILCFSTTEDPGVVFDNVRDVYVCICGLGWGIGSVLFGLGIVYVGNALTFGITLSLSSTVGSILPLFIFQTESAGKAIALFYWAGLVVAIVGVVVLSWAGITKEKEIAAKKGNRNGGGSTNDEVVGLDGSINNDVNDDDDDDSSSSSSSSGGISSDKDSNSSDDDDDFREEFDDGSGSNRKSKSEKRTQMEVGIVICVVSGVFSAMLNVGLASGDPIRVKAEECGTPKYVSNSPVWFLGICSGNFVNLGYAIYLLFKNKYKTNKQIMHFVKFIVLLFVNLLVCVCVCAEVGANTKSSLWECFS